MIQVKNRLLKFVIKGGSVLFTPFKYFISMHVITILACFLGNVYTTASSPPIWGCERDKFWAILTSLCLFFYFFSFARLAIQSARKKKGIASSVPIKVNISAIICGGFTILWLLDYHLLKVIKLHILDFVPPYIALLPITIVIFSILTNAAIKAEVDVDELYTFDGKE